MNKFRGALLLAAATLVMTTVTSAPSYADKQYGNFLVKGKIQQEYERTGGPNKWGNPTIAESNADRNGKFQRFAKNTSFYWQANVAGGKANQIGGLIRDEWGNGGFERGALGFPITNEIGLPRYNGAYNNFEYGSIYWEGYSDTGAHTVFPGPIRDAWAGEGYEGSYPIPGQDGHKAFGYPQSEEYSNGNGREQDFEHGKIRTNINTNAVEIVQGGEYTNGGPPIDKKTIVAQLPDVMPEKCGYRSFAEYYNNVVYVTDKCDDNIAAVGRIAWKDKNGKTQNRFCIGGTVNTTTRCQFVLTAAEGNSRSVTAGLETDPGGDQPQYGRAELFFQE